MVRKPVLLADNRPSPDLPYPLTPTSPAQAPPQTSEPQSSIPPLVERPYDTKLESAQNENVWSSEAGVSNEMRLPPILRAGELDLGPNWTDKSTNSVSLRVGSADVTPRSSSESQRPPGVLSDTPVGREEISRNAHSNDRLLSNNPFRWGNGENGQRSEPQSYEGASSAEAWCNDSRKFSVSQAGQSDQTQPAILETWKDPIAVSAVSAASAASADCFHPPGMDFDSSLYQSSSASGNGALASSEPVAEAAFDHEIASLESAANTTDWNAELEAAESLSKIERPIMRPFSEDPIKPPAFFPSEPPQLAQIDQESAAVGLGAKEIRTNTPVVAGGTPKPVATNETYQIRLINWYDVSSHPALRKSPIMVQNANGPCPLLALVNALVLSTPSHLKTALVETLRVREQVSLGFLLDAVIDELMSERRGDPTQELPDISDLYAFLVNLHTGMNVNPCFVGLKEEVTSQMDAIGDHPISLSDLRKPGGFEVTREMRLYSTFAIPLIHGWIPPRNHPAFAALKRTARTYEDAQNIMFREEELEDKLQRHGLSADEQVMLEDITSVKYFLSSTATQLTGYGLDSITEAQAPGSIAILFRNDHFSTLYRHPKSGQLLTLVTDMGYAGHDEVVWESLVDVSGEGCEFFAGDFRPVGNVVGNDVSQPTDAYADNGDGWTTVSGKARNSNRTKAANSHDTSQTPSDLPQLETLDLRGSGAPMSPNTEQEDHDLALAMQLQEEEEERERSEAAARRRENELSQEYLKNSDGQGRRSGPRVPPRGGSVTGQTTSRQAPRPKSSSEDAPPPSYEQAAKSPVYQPVSDRQSPSPMTGSQRPLPPRPRQQSAYNEHATTSGGSPTNIGPPRRGHGFRGRGIASGGVGGLEGAPGVVRRRSDALSPSTEDEKKNKDCVVM